MKQSQLFGKTRKNISADEVAANAQLLIKGGFIEKVAAGVYAFLPLGLRVLGKIERIVRDEMDTLGSELLLPGLSPKELWKTTDRLESVDVLMKASPASKLAAANNTNEYIINPTHEDVVTPIAKLFNQSHKDLPFGVYQIQTKFRNEPRPKSGLLRCREFRMKDLYSFHESEDNLLKFYDEAKAAYARVFDRLGLGSDTVVAKASGGDFTQNFSHEFQTRCVTGEDLIFEVPSTGEAYNREIAPAALSQQYEDEQERDREDVEGRGLIGVEALAKFLDIPIERTTKTLLYETEDGRLVAAAIRGDYEVNELKLLTVVGAKSLSLLPENKIEQLTGAEVGYAGLLDLPDSFQIVMDNSMEGRKNFEMGANKTNYHTINVNFGRDLPTPESFHDIKLAKEGDLHPETGETYSVYRAAEVGNIFPLETKFSESFGYTFTAEDGSQHPVYMGSYGIGTSRVMGVLVEKFHDDAGIVWPAQVAPYQVHLIGIRHQASGISSAVEELYQELVNAGIEVLYDDRDISAGQKFADADLIGIQIRLVVSQKTLATDSVEWKRRKEDTTELVKRSTLVKKLKEDV